MLDGRHFENRYIAISQRNNEILYTAADFKVDEHHVIKNEKVALDRLRVRQNVFLLCLRLLLLASENNLHISLVSFYFAAFLASEKCMAVTLNAVHGSLWIWFRLPCVYTDGNVV